MLNFGASKTAAVAGALILRSYLWYSEGLHNQNTVKNAFRTQSEYSLMLCHAALNDGGGL